jgi:hypothetical protein
VQPHAGGIGGGEATPGQQRSDLVHRAGDGGAVHPVQHRQGLVGQLEAEDHQGDQDPVAEAQAVVGAGAGGAPAWVAAALLGGGLVGGGPGLGQLDGQLGQVLPGQPGEARMGEGRTGPCWRRHPRMITPCGPLTLARAMPKTTAPSPTKSLGSPSSALAGHRAAPGPCRERRDPATPTMSADPLAVRKAVGTSDEA